MPPQQPFAVPTKPPIKTNMSEQWGSTLFYLITLTIAFSAFSLTWAPPLSGSVTLLVKNSNGASSVKTYSLLSRSMSDVAGINPSLVSNSSARLYQRPDGSVIGLTKAGVVLADIKNRTTVLIASAVAPTMRTPFSVWGGGDKIAWMSPTDSSIQVFARTARGTYVPIVLNKTISPNSLGFTDDGTTLVVARYIRSGTELYGMKVPGGTLTKVATIPGVAAIIPKP